MDEATRLVTVVRVGPWWQSEGAEQDGPLIVDEHLVHLALHVVHLCACMYTRMPSAYACAHAASTALHVVHVVHVVHLFLDA